MLLLIAIASVGCANRVKLAETDAAFAARLASAGSLALGGVTVATALDAEFAPEDAPDADDALYRAFLTARPDLVVWPAPAVGRRAGADTLAAVVAEFASYGRLRPDQVTPLAGALAECRFLVIARLSEDAISSNAQRQDLADPEARAEGLPEHRISLPPTVLTERAITVALAIFDLADGSTVWQGESRSRDRARYEYRDELGSEGTAYLQERLAAAGGPRRLSRRGDFLKAPDLIDLIEQALTALVKRLPGAPDAGGAG